MNHFSQLKRINKKAEYDLAFDQAKKVVMSHFIFFYKPNDKNIGRLGLVIPKRKISKAHDRNRTKRLLRESFRCQTLPAVDIIVLARQEVATVSNHVLMNQIGKAWEKITQHQ
ncbi:MAG: ribonuclease P protein component [Gammaproteobacteria bacterium]|nr:ribonuclease P protein component [Gammaproteobacteria bacterium]